MEEFDEEWYLRQNPDVASAVSAKRLRSGRDHYIQRGFLERRPYRDLTALREDFDEAWYLLSNPDVASEIRSKRVRSAYDHFIHHGRFERRLGSPVIANTTEISSNVEIFRLSSGRALFLVGWLNDFADPCDLIAVKGDDGRETFERKSFWRFARADVEKFYHTAERAHGLGLFTASVENRRFGQECCLEFYSATAKLANAYKQTELVSDVEMLSGALEFLAACPSVKNAYLRATRDLESGFGEELLRLNQRILADHKNFAVTRFNAAQRSPTKSFITCIFGHPHFLTLQVSLFSKCANFNEIEFIYFCNSPESNEELQQRARQASRLYGAPITLIQGSCNLGFAAGNNVAARYASTDRLVFINPDVLPKNDNWLLIHDAFVASSAGKFFGARLYYDDGSVMHAGMYFEQDTFVDTDAEVRKLLRVEHYSKGFPDWIAEVQKTRIVPAVTGAFMSIERRHFELLGGFEESYVWGNYEDADICLRSAALGQPVWYCGNIHLWHLEGKGSVRSLSREGASMLNRWQFTRKWLSTLMQPGRLNTTEVSENVE